MIDKFDFRVPFKNEHVISPKDGESGWVDLESLGLPSLKGSISVGNNGKYEVDELEHCYESVPSSFTPMAFKVFKGGQDYWPHIRLKASPAKLLQGHNVFGPDNPVHGMELLYLISATYPDLAEKLDFKFTEIMNIDCTYSGDLPSKNLGLPVIEYLSNVDNKQLKFSQGHDSSVYFNKGSEHGSLKVYLKALELENQLREFKRRNANNSFDEIIKIMSDDKLQKYAENKIRIEATLTKRKLKDLGIPSLYFQFIKYFDEQEKLGENVIQKLFMFKSAPLFESLRGGTVNVYNDDEVRDKLRAKHARVNKKGKTSFNAAMAAFRTYRNIAADGYNETKAEMVSRTFNMHVRMMMEAGISKAALQNLHKGRSTGNILPILNVINIDFGNQYPDWYQEPVSPFSDKVVSIHGLSQRGQNLRLAV